MTSFAGLGRFLALVVAAVIGGAVAIGAVSLTGALESTTTVVTETSAEPSSQLGRASSAGMSVNEIYRRAASGVVRINATTNSTATPGTGNPWGTPQQSAIGSGFVIDKTGHIVTNYHVVEGADIVTVSFSNRDTVKAEIVGTDPSSDLAVLRVNTSASALTPLALGNSDHLQVGDPVVAIGNPFGLDRTVTAGIVSAIQRAITAPNGYTIDHVIQTDAAINHGNSGGPLLNRRGQVIGVNSQIETGSSSDTSGNVGIGFAIPSNTVKTVIAQLIREGHIDRAFLGISATPITRDLARVFRLPATRGLLVQSVQPGSGAAKAGLEAGTTQVVLAGESYKLGGDIVVAAAGQPVASLDKLRDIVAAKKPGDSIHVVVYRAGKRKTIDVKLGRQPTAPG